MTHELRALTSVRGIAAWLVVFFHIRKSIAGLPDAAMAVLSKGYLAVDFFFLLSGFVIWVTYADRLRSGGLGAVPAFLKRRVARIWPLHLFMLGVAVALALALRATGRPAEHFPFAELPLHILLLQNWGFTRALAWNDPAWSISCELGAYLLFALLALSVDWRRAPSWVLVAALAGLMLALHGLFVADGATTLGQDIPRIGLLRCVIEFAGGTLIGALWLRWRDRPELPATIAAMIAAGLFAGWIGGWLPETLAVPTSFAALLLALALAGDRTPLAARPLHALGEISYATYLGHYLLWFAFKLVLVRDADAVAWPLIALYLLLVLASSVALYHGVERPAQRWINRLRLGAGTRIRPIPERS